MDLTFVKALLSISKGYTVTRYFEKKDISKESKIREKINKDIVKYGAPLFKMINMDPDVALLSIRLKQGDFYIIEDMEEFLRPILPTSKIRKLTMGVLGMITCPVHYDNEMNAYPQTFKKKVTYEGALELVSDVLDLDPIVSRLATFDYDAYDAIESKLKFPKQAVIYIFLQ